MKSEKEYPANSADKIKLDKIELPSGYKIPEGHGHDADLKSVREVSYRDKKIRVETTYTITVDGEPVKVHTMVLNDGTLHCHSFPNYIFASAIDMVKKLIDSSDTRVPDNELGGGH